MFLKNLRITTFLGLYFITCFFQVNGQQPYIKDGLHRKGIVKSETPIFLQPNKNANRNGKLPPFSIVYVFQDQGTYKMDGFIWVGNDPEEADGWIPESKFVEWNSRVCVKFSPLIGREPALIYPAKENLNEIFKDRDTKKGLAIAEEPGNVAENKYRMLFPITKHANAIAGRKSYKIFEIAYLGQELDGTSSVSIATPSFSSEKAALELLFVVDATSSMQEYIIGIKNVVKQIADKVNGMRESGVYYGLLSYRDRTKYGPIEYVTKRHLPLEKNYIKVLSTIEEIKATDVDSEDLSECVYDGLFAGITETRWSQTKSSLRVIILIGDASAHNVTSDKNPMQYALEQIRDDASRNRVRIIALQLNRGVNKADADKFKDQARTLAQGKTISDKGYYDEILILDNGQIDPAYVTSLTKAIEDEVDRMQYLIPKNASTSNMLPQDKAIIMKSLVSNSGSGEITFSKGWVSEVNINNDLQVQPYVFMTRNELAIYLKILSNIVLSVDDINDNSILNIQISSIEKELGEQFDQSKNFESVLKQKFQIPFNSRILNISFEEIKGWNNRKKRNLIDVVDHKYDLLKEFFGNQSNWFQFPGSQKRYSFIPLKYLP